MRSANAPLYHVDRSLGGKKVLFPFPSWDGGPLPVECDVFVVADAEDIGRVEVHHNEMRTGTLFTNTPFTLSEEQMKRFKHAGDRLIYRS